jgi:hypothetical protein
MNELSGPEANSAVLQPVLHPVDIVDVCTFLVLKLTGKLPISQPDFFAHRHGAER